MSTRKHGGADGQSYIFKIASVVILVLIFGALFLIQKEMRKAGGTAQAYVQPVEKGTFKEAKEPAQPRVPPPAVPSMTPDAQPRIAVPPPKAGSPPVLPTFTQAPVRSAAPPPPRTSQPGIQMLPAPVTEVHPLSDAEEVMGAPSSELGEVGVTRTYKLPEQEGQDETLPPPNE